MGDRIKEEGGRFRHRAWSIESRRKAEGQDPGCKMQDAGKRISDCELMKGARHKVRMQLTAST